MGIGAILALVVLAAIGLLLIFAARKPDVFRIERRIRIAAPPETVFAKINDLVAWQDWSPWARKDPDARAEFGEITAGEGASFSWDGNNKVGKGTMTIIESYPPAQVVFRLDFEKPFKATNIAEFAVRPAGEGSEVIWAMHGPASLMSKVMDVLMNMDRMVGRDFEAGLASLRTVSEAKPA